MAPTQSLLVGFTACFLAFVVAVSVPGSATMFRTSDGSFTVSLAVEAGVCADQTSTAHIHVVFDGKFVDEICTFSCSTPVTHCEAVISRYQGAPHPLKATAYAVIKDGTNALEAHRISDVVLDASPSSPSGSHPLPSKSLQSTSSLHVGVLYEGWHTFAATAMATIANRGGVQLTVEDVIRSNGNYQLSQILDKYNERAAADSFFYQVEPDLGYYCIYTKRANESGIVPDCPNVNGTLKTHANQLTSAGVSFVVMDATNLPVMTTEADAIQVRPAEVLFETWAAFRQQGIETPSISIWQTCPPGGTLWQNALTLYNTYPDLVHSDPVSGKKVFFVPSDNQDASILSQVASNGGRNDVVVVTMWAQFDPSEFAQGRWAFFSPCLDPGTGGYTTNVAGAGISSCNQHITTNSPIGTAMTASPSYQMQYSSTPFGAAGKFGGMTFKRQFAGVLSALASPNPPSHLFLSSYNEFIAQPQPNPFNSGFAFSQGLPNDPMRASLWVDTYGASISRDIAPTVEGGSIYYDIMASCLSVASLGLANPGLLSLNSSTFGGSCAVGNELCCTYNASTDAWHNVWALRLPGDTYDRLMTTDTNELNILVSQGWQQVCNPFVGPTAFCVDQSLLQSSESWKGPFAIASSPGPDNAFTPIYRCLRSDNLHFFSIRADCEGQKTESMLGYVSPVRNSNTPRLLRRCHHPAGVTAIPEHYYHALDGTCDAGDADEGEYGYVH